MNQKLISAKNYVVKNRAKFAAATTFAMCVVVQMKIADQMNERLKEIGAYDAYWADEEE